MAIFELAVVFLTLLMETVDAKECQHIFESGQIHYFVCHAFEFCCGARCCRSRAITFYQLWYFWLMVFLTMLLCSGGGWWYRFHRHTQFTHPTQITMSQRNTGQPNIAGTYYTSGAVAPAPPQVYQPSAPQFSAPPPYSGPPPSYESVVKQQSQPN